MKGGVLISGLLLKGGVMIVELFMLWVVWLKTKGCGFKYELLLLAVVWLEMRGCWIDVFILSHVNVTWHLDNTSAMPFKFSSSQRISVWFLR